MVEIIASQLRNAGNEEEGVLQLPSLEANLATIPWLFDSPEIESSRRVIYWWELRRIPYNVFIAVFAAVNLFTIIYWEASTSSPGKTL